VEADRFDLLARALSISGSRRVALATVLGGMLVPLFGLADGEAKNKHKKKGKGKKRRRKPPTCTDGIRNGSETGVDCGGPDCPRCANSQTCLSRDDCAGALCSDGTCQACSSIPNTCGMDAGGSCLCTARGTGGTPVCTTGFPTGTTVTSCESCPTGTVCVSFGSNFNCHRRCGAP
jgi:hypothetical protein